MSFLRQTMALCLALAAAAAWAQTPPYPSFQVQSSPSLQAAARQLAALINRDRMAQGIRPLQWDPALAEAARRHCWRMVEEGTIAHRYDDEPSLSNRAAEAGARFSLIEENVAVGPDPSAIETAWMHSPGHRANLLNPGIDRVGAAAVADHGVLYAVADFARAVPALTREQVEAAIASLVRVSGVAVLPDPAAARAACSTDQGVPTSISGVLPRFIMRWQGSDLNRLPGDLAEKLASGSYRQAAIGSCPPHEEQGGFTAYRVAVLLY
ncbi:MAG: CAP domain-containing protein [Terracidiphilus sp.]